VIQETKSGGAMTKNVHGTTGDSKFGQGEVGEDKLPIKSKTGFPPKKEEIAT